MDCIVTLLYHISVAETRYRCNPLKKGLGATETRTCNSPILQRCSGLARYPRRHRNPPSRPALCYLFISRSLTCDTRLVSPAKFSLISLLPKNKATKRNKFPQACEFSVLPWERPDPPNTANHHHLATKANPGVQVFLLSLTPFSFPLGMRFLQNQTPFPRPASYPLSPPKGPTPPPSTADHHHHHATKQTPFPRRASSPSLPYVYESYGK